MPRQTIKETVPHRQNKPLPESKRSHGGGIWRLSIILLTIALISLVLEYIGVINAIPKFGRMQPYTFNLIGLQKGSFPDISADLWSHSFIQKLGQQDVVVGYPNGEFRPQRPITRGEFAAMLYSAFPPNATVSESQFQDVSQEYWGTPAITNATERGFFTGYPGGDFRPNQTMSKADALVAITNGLNLQPNNSISQTLSRYQDAQQIPDYAKSAVAAATEAGIVVNYPNENRLNPQQNLTRAEASSLMYQALVSQGKANEIPSQFIVNGSP